MGPKVEGERLDFQEGDTRGVAEEIHRKAMIKSYFRG